MTKIPESLDDIYGMDKLELWDLIETCVQENRNLARRLVEWQHRTRRLEKVFQDFIDFHRRWYHNLPVQCSQQADEGKLLWKRVNEECGRAGWGYGDPRQDLEETIHAAHKAAGVYKEK